LKVMMDVFPQESQRFISATEDGDSGFIEELA